MAKRLTLRVYAVRWLHAALTHSLGIIDLWSGLIAAFLGILAHFLPQWEAGVNNLLWQVPLWSAAAVVFVRFVMAPYWLAQQDAELIAGLADRKERQAAIDALSEELSWAIAELLNKRPSTSLSITNFASEAAVEAWELGFRSWCDKVSGMLENRVYFTRSDQLHFDRLGVVSQLKMSGHSRLDWLLSQLSLKFERLRDVIAWAQQRIS